MIATHICTVESYVTVDGAVVKAGHPVKAGQSIQVTVPSPQEVVPQPEPHLVVPVLHGLIMTDDTNVDNRYIKAKIISCGNLVEGLNDGDTIYYDKHAGHAITWKMIYTKLYSHEMLS